MEVRFYGVRGSIAVSGAHAAGIGGNTSCLEVTSQGHRLILDAGTGIRALGEVMMREGAPRKATLFFSHLHWDHVQGFPFFSPGYLPTTELELYGPGPDGDSALATVVRTLQSREAHSGESTRPEARESRRFDRRGGRQQCPRTRKPLPTRAGS